MAFSPQELTGIVAHQRQQATAAVQATGLIIGESHDNPHARGLIGNLIQAGVVTHLFLETPDIDRDNAFGGGGTGTLGAWLRERAAGDGAARDIRTDPDWVRFRDPEGSPALGLWKYDALSPERRALGRNPATIANLIEFAVRHGVQVHLVDHPDTALMKPVSMSARNRAMAAGLNQVRDQLGLQNFSGCVLLVGEAHRQSATLEALNMGSLAVHAAGH